MRNPKWVVIILALFPILLHAQDSELATLEDAPRVFIDCQFCDQQFIRQEVPYLNYVRDRNVADVHILVTRMNNGGGGEQFNLAFMGKKRFDGIADTSIVNTEPDYTWDEIRRTRVDAIKLGMMTYIARTSLIKDFTITYDREIEPTSVNDPWRNWVFRINLNGWMNGQEIYNRFEVWSRLSVNKITPEWKLEFDATANYDEQNFVIDEQKVKGLQRSQSASLRVVKSLGDHWAIGAFSEASSSLYNNIQLKWFVNPALEYNFFPYDQSTTKQFRISWFPGPDHRFYNETTIFDKEQEFLFRQTLEVAMGLQQKWGAVNFSVSGSHFFHDFSKNNLGVWANVRLNLFKGFQFRIGGGARLIRDQLSLPKAGATDEDILLQQRQLATNYRYHSNIGITYTFGSIYNTVVNPRFGD